jgi:tRNA pseudouridine38-40 synthase
LNETIRIKLVIEYDGLDFAGWQVQPDVITVQGELEKALKQMFGYHIRMNGSGRTDAGVHSTGQVAHCDIPAGKNLYKLQGGLNGLTSESIAVKSVEEVADTFNARHDAVSRRYRYYFSMGYTAIFRNYVCNLGRTPDIDYLNRLSKLILGQHDFDAVSKLGSDVEHFKSIVYTSHWFIEHNLLVYEISAIRFLRGMVRGLVGTFLDFEFKKRDVEDFIKLLDSKDRSLAGSNAPAHGLILEEVCYE